MLHSVDVGSRRIDDYRRSAGEDAVDELLALAEPLAGARILHLNATPYGGGVAEILRSEVPLLRDLGLHADWQLATGDDAFFTVTKAIHNGLQGASRELSATERDIYLAQSARTASLLEGGYDIIVAHDPQPLAVPAHSRHNGARWVWRCHIDTSEPNPTTWDFLRPFLSTYDAAVFTLESFVPADFPISRVAIVPPAIDPESPKNVELDLDLARRVVSWIGVDIDRPFITQISRFDPWKDPLGVIAVYRQVREAHPGLQLVLAGSMALDDPEGWDLYRTITAETRGDFDIDVATNLTGVGNIEVNALQRLAEVVIQKSIREGFGLVVSEALWKGTPVVAGRAGGIPLQLEQGGGHLVDTTEECAARVLDLLDDPLAALAQGERGRRNVHDRFLLTRLLADELRLYRSVLDAPSTVATAPAPGVLPTS